MSNLYPSDNTILSANSVPETPSRINKKIQFFKFLGSVDMVIDSLPSNTLNQIDIIYSIDPSGNWLSWTNGGLNSLTSLQKYKTYLIISKNNNPNYTLYNNTDVIDFKTFTLLNNNINLETYRGLSSLNINNSNLNSSASRVFGVSSDGLSYLSWDKDLPTNLNSLNNLQPNVGYLFIVNNIPTTLWTETLTSSNNWTYRKNDIIMMKFVPANNTSDIQVFVPLVEYQNLPELGQPIPIPNTSVVISGGVRIGDLIFTNSYLNKSISINLSGVSYTSIVKNGQIIF